MSSGTVIALVVACVLPTAVGYLFVLVKRARARYDASRAPLPGRPIERIHHDIRRLHELLDVTENAAADLPAKNQRCQATRAAYLDALSVACRELDVLPPAGQPVSRAEIYRVEAALRRVGLDVRPVG